MTLFFFKITYLFYNPKVRSKNYDVICEYSIDQDQLKECFVQNVTQCYYTYVTEYSDGIQEKCVDFYWKTCKIAFKVSIPPIFYYRQSHKRNLALEKSKLVLNFLLWCITSIQVIIVQFKLK